MIETITKLILDMDGVLWRGNTPLPGLQPFFDHLKTNRYEFVLATNNASKRPLDYVERLASYGVTVKPEQIITSAIATASYLKQQYPPGTAIYPIGEAGLREALEEAGFHLLSNTTELADLPKLTQQEASLVVVGFCRQLHYTHIAAANLFLERGANLIGTNPDLTFPHELGQLPGAGATISLLEMTSGQKALIIGKPGAIMFEEAIRRLNGSPSEIGMVGDRINTDIAGAQKVGLQTILLLTGITCKTDLAYSMIEPNWVFAGLPELTNALPARVIA